MQKRGGQLDSCHPTCKTQSEMAEWNSQQADQALAKVRQQVSMQAVQDLVQKLTEKCFEKCVYKPGADLSNKEQRCMESCIDNYLETMKIVQQGMLKQSE